MYQFEIFEHFNLSKRKDLIKSKTYQRTKDKLQAAIHDKSWIAFAGPIGSGKTETVYEALDELNDKSIRLVEIMSPDRQGIKIAHVMNSIIYQLGDEMIARTSKRKDMEARMMQVLNILSAAKKKGCNVVITIDEAHELHGNTLKAIKRLREYRFRGKSDLMTIVMIGQEGLTAKLERDDEVGLRCDYYDFKYTEAELVEIAKYHSFGMLADDEAHEIAHRFGTPLSIKKHIFDAMARAYKIGAESIELKHFEFPEDSKPPTREDRKKIEVELDDADKVDTELKSAS